MIHIVIVLLQLLTSTNITSSFCSTSLFFWHYWTPKSLRILKLDRQYYFTYVSITKNTTCIVKLLRV